MRRAGALATALIAFAILNGPAVAQGSDPFAAACMTRVNATPTGCACQAKLARANLDRKEQQVALMALRGQREAFGAQVKAMGQAKAQAFSAKMSRLGERSRAECR